MVEFWENLNFTHKATEVLFPLWVCQQFLFNGKEKVRHPLTRINFFLVATDVILHIYSPIQSCKNIGKLSDWWQKADPVLSINKDCKLLNVDL